MDTHTCFQDIGKAQGLLIQPLRNSLPAKRIEWFVSSPDTYNLTQYFNSDLKDIVRANYKGNLVHVGQIVTVSHKDTQLLIVPQVIQSDDKSSAK